MRGALPIPVAGGGIGGPMAALAPLSAGIEVHERAAALREISEGRGMTA